MGKKALVSLAALLGVAVSLGFAGAGGAVSASPGETATQAAAAKPGYVGMDTCLTCHADVVKAFKHTPHAGNIQGCEGCHGPGQAHVDGGGDKTKIRNFKSLSAVDSSATCMECHNKGNQKHWMGSTHDSRNIACVTCHDPHPKAEVLTALLRKPQMLLCTGCHLQKKAQLLRPGHMPLREGKMACSTCHNMHGSTNVKLLRKGDSIAEMCTSCHADKRGPFLFEHAPSRDGCVTCHDPHGSTNERMLVVKTPMLCQRCHVGTRHPSTIYDEALITTNIRVYARSCVTCHANIHGSNHPSGRYFIR